MLRPRIIPCLLVHQGGLTKTIGFAEGKYVGDPLNAVRIFNEKQVDELIVLDIDATVERREPDYALVEKLALECRMPLCYGGGVKTADQVERIVGLGVEKVSLGSAPVAAPELVTEAGRRVGAQSVVVVIDVKKTGLLRRYEVVTHNGTRGTGRDPVAFARSMADAGAGEIVVNSVDRDGGMEGYDTALVRRIVDSVPVPVTALGGAGSLQHVQDLVREFGIIGAAAGSLFVFKGKFRAVLINYPDAQTRAQMIDRVDPP